MESLVGRTNGLVDVWTVLMWSGEVSENVECLVWSGRVNLEVCSVLVWSGEVSGNVEC